MSTNCPGIEVDLQLINFLIPLLVAYIRNSQMLNTVKAFGEKNTEIYLVFFGKKVAADFTAEI